MADTDRTETNWLISPSDRAGDLSNESAESIEGTLHRLSHQLVVNEGLVTTATCNPIFPPNPLCPNNGNKPPPCTSLPPPNPCPDQGPPPCGTLNPPDPCPNKGGGGGGDDDD